MKDFAKNFLGRKKIAMEHGDRPKVAKAAGVSEVAVSRWGTVLDQSVKLPTVYECERVAETLDVSACWLAFGEGPQNRAAAAYAFSIAKKLQADPRLATLIASFDTAGESGKQALEGLAKVVAPTRPAGSIIESDVTTKTKATTAPRISVAEEAPAYPMPRKQVTARNDRDRIAEFKIVKRGKRTAKKLPKWLGMAAGPGRELQLCPDFLYLVGLDHARDLHAVIVTGDSMEETLHDNDAIVLQAFGDTGIILEPLEPGQEKGPVQRLQAQVPDDSICVVQIDQDPPTLKRVRYHGEHTDDWKITIEADNPPAWNNGKAFPIEREHHFVIWAKLLGLAK